MKRLTKLEDIEYKTASRLTRFVHLILDQVIISVIGFFIGVIFIYVAGVEFANRINLIIINYTFWFLYYTFFEGMFSQTLAKMVTRTRVVDECGNMIGLKAALIRSLCRIIPFEPFSFLGGDIRGWHDTLSKTYVLNTKDLDILLASENQQEENIQENIIDSLVEK